MKKLKDLISNIKYSISVIDEDEVFNNLKEWKKHSDIISNGEIELKKEYSKRVKKIEQLQEELKEIEKASNEFNFNR
ncbi:hypothetical protein [Bacillus safensis]|uniref:hypothetical protein n=1 Tax=Bacillus safensis TaxID=561879 RepID=UPI002E1BF9E0|nr:hypothetical protein [Bacillus safensis]